MDMRRYIKRKEEFDEVDEQPSLKRKTSAQKVAASHHGSDADANESTGAEDAATDGELLLVSTILSRLVKIAHELVRSGVKNT